MYILILYTYTYKYIEFKITNSFAGNNTKFLMPAGLPFWWELQVTVVF